MPFTPESKLGPRTWCPMRESRDAERFETGPAFDQCHAVEIDVTGRGRDRLHRELPIDQIDERLRDIGNDVAAAGRTERGEEAAVGPEHDDRRLRAQRPLAGRRRVRHRPSVDHGLKGEIGQFVVEHETAGRDLRAEAGFDRRRHRDDLAAIVHDGKVARSHLDLRAFAVRSR